MKPSINKRASIDFGLNALCTTQFVNRIFSINLFQTDDARLRAHKSRVLFI